MTEAHRSRVPDLLFEDEQHERVSELGPLLDAPEKVGPETPLHRLTVFLTYRCNLTCPYCKTIPRSEAELEARPQKANSHDLGSFEALLDAHAGTPLRHLHFTGGEAATVVGLAQMVALARQRGVEAISMTSNGTLPARVYLGLVEAGLDELRISLDASDAVLGERLTGREHAFRKTVDTLRGLSAARVEGAKFFLIINSVIGTQNRAQLPELLGFLLGFDPDDVKLITEVDQRGRLADFPGVEGVRRQLSTLLDRHPRDRFPLLRRKLETVFAADAIGLDRSRPRAGSRAGWRCYIPLTERTVDRDYYYPCSVYLREGGNPLGALTDSPDDQRQKSAAFVRDSDCTTDPICQRYCLHCTRAFNDVANATRP